MENKEKIFDMRTKRLSFICIVFSALAIVISSLLQALTTNQIDIAILLFSILISVEFHIVLYIIEESKHLKINNILQEDMSDVAFDNIIKSLYATIVISFIMLFINKEIGYFSVAFYMFIFLCLIPLNFSLKKNNNIVKNWIKTIVHCVSIYCFLCAIAVLLIETTSADTTPTINRAVITHTFNIDVNTIINIATSVIIAGIVCFIELKHSKKIEIMNEQHRQQKIIDDANRFIIENIDEIQWLPLCPIACMHNKYHNYHRKIYKLFNAQPEEVKQEILKIKEIKFPTHYDGNFYNDCLDSFKYYHKEIVQKNNTFTKENGKYLEMSLRCGSKPIHIANKKENQNYHIGAIIGDCLDDMDNNIIEKIMDECNFNSNDTSDVEAGYIATETIRILSHRWNHSTYENEYLNLAKYINPEIYGYDSETLEDLYLYTLAEIYMGQLQEYHKIKSKNDHKKDSV